MRDLKLTKSYVFKIVAYTAMIILQCGMFVNISNRRCGDILTQMILLVAAYDIIALGMDIIGTKGKGNPLLYCIPGIIITFGATTQAVVNPLYGFFGGLTDYTKSMFVSFAVLIVAFIIGRNILTLFCSNLILYNVLFVGTVVFVIVTCVLRGDGEDGFYALYVLGVTPYIITTSVILNSTRTSELFIFKNAKFSKGLDDSEYKLIISMLFTACCFIPLIVIGEFGTLLVEACVYIVMLIVYSADIREAFTRILKNRTKRIVFIVIVGILIVAIVLKATLDWSECRSKIERIIDLFRPLDSSIGLTQQQKARVNIFTGGPFGLGDLADMRRTEFGGSDMIFQSLCQVWGYVGGLSVTALFVVWSVIAFKVSRLTFSFGNQDSRNYNSISRLFCVGNIVSILLHLFVNIGSNTGALPVCGISLPLISRGGSSMVSVMIGIALVWHRDYYCSAYKNHENNLDADKVTKKEFLDGIKKKIISVWLCIKGFFCSKKLKIAVKTVGYVIAILVFISLAAVISASVMLDNIAKSVNHIEVEGLGSTEPALAVSDMELVSDDNIVNVLVLGTDKEENANSRSDAIIIISINTEENTIKYVRLARDSYVEIPGKEGRHKLTEAYSYGGAQLTAATVEANFRVSIDGVCVFDFDSAAEVIDNLGGVDINITKAEAEEIINHVAGELEIRDGVQTLTGEQAVYFARIRRLDDNFGREKRQQKLVDAVIKKIVKEMPGLVFKADDIAKNISSSFSVSEIKELFFEIIEILLEKKQNSILAQEAMVGVPEETESLVRAIYADKDITEEELEKKISEETDRALSRIAKEYKSEKNGGILIIDDFMKIPIEQSAANRNINGSSVLDLYVPYNAEEIIEFIYGEQEA